MSGRGMQRKSLRKSEIAQGDVILVDFSYSDLQRSKFRPALVMSNSGYNSKSPDIVVLRITSKHRRRWAIKLTNEDLESGILDVESYVKVDSIFTIEKRMVAKVVGRLKGAKVNEVWIKMTELFEAV